MNAPYTTAPIPVTLSDLQDHSNCLNPLSSTYLEKKARMLLQIHFPQL